MSQVWIGPVLLAALCLAWFAVQRAWLACMGESADKDALERPGYCGGSCACRGDCPNRHRSGVAAASGGEETEKRWRAEARRRRERPSNI